MALLFLYYFCSIIFRNEAKDPDMILININTGPHPPGFDELQPDMAIG